MERHRTHTPYADTGILQTICVASALRLELTKGACNHNRTNFACSIVSKGICLQLTKFTGDFAKNEWFINNSVVVIVLQTVLYAFLFLSGICLSPTLIYKTTFSPQIKDFFKMFIGFNK